MLDMSTVTHLHPKIAADTLAARLLLLRHEMGWSQRKAATLTGVPYRVWQGMESGLETRGLDRHVVAIAAASGYDRDWLMWGGPLSDPTSPTTPDAGSVTRQNHCATVLQLVPALVPAA